jgi:cell division ATPase FtsA
MLARHRCSLTGVSVSAAGQTINSTSMSLGRAIHELRPNLSQTQINQESQRAEKQAKETERTNTTS